MRNSLVLSVFIASAKTFATPKTAWAIPTPEAYIRTTTKVGSLRTARGIDGGDVNGPGAVETRMCLRVCRRDDTQHRHRYPHRAHQSPSHLLIVSTGRYYCTACILHFPVTVNPRERWQTLQSHLSAARGALATGAKASALEHIEAALVIDPEFLAARMLRDRVTSPEPETPAITSSTPQAGVVTEVAAAPPTVAHVDPVVALSPATLASFEERVKQRVRNREAAAARSAVVNRQRVRVAIQLAAAAVFLTAISSTALYEPRVLPTRTLSMASRLIEVEPPAPLLLEDSEEQSAYVRTEQPLVRPAPTALAVTAMVDAPPEPVRAQPPAPAPPPQPAPQPAAQAQPSSAPPPTAHPVQMLPPRPMPDVTTAANVVPSSAPAVVPALLVSTVDDRSLVDQTLQRYRRAYNRLDAQSAHAAYPAVNTNALARAFDSLESQSLAFENCDIDLQGLYATATCHGTSLYVPKIGNRAPRIEPRVWTFMLRKDEGDWKIQSARTAQ